MIAFKTACFPEIIRAFRIVKTRRADTAFDGEGARRAGGRWNGRGTRVVYLAKTISLAALEILVHLDDAGLRASYSFIPISFPAACVLMPGKNGVAPLSEEWAETPAPLDCARYGDDWVKSGASLVLRIPSVIVPWESNFLLNPAHPDLNKAKIGEPQSFDFDPRLIQTMGDQTSESP